MTAPRTGGHMRRLILAVTGLILLALAAWLLLLITADAASLRSAAARPGPATPLDRVASIATARRLLK